jgi:hypothetical protein
VESRSACRPLECGAHRTTPQDVWGKKESKSPVAGSRERMLLLLLDNLASVLADQAKRYHAAR